MDFGASESPSQSAKRKKGNVDWNELYALVELGDSKQLLDKFEEWMRMSKSFHFRYMREGFQMHCLSKMKVLEQAQFLVDILSYLAAQDPNVQYVTVLSHLFVELIGDIFNEQVAMEVKPRTIPLFVTICTPERARLAVKVAPIFHLEVGDLPKEFDLLEYIHDLLEDPNSYTPGVGLLQHFPSLTSHFDIKVIFHKLLSNGHESLAEKWAASLDRSAKIDFVEECLALEKMRTASSAVRSFELLVEYPHVERLYREGSVAKLLDKGLWSPALALAGEDKKLQETIIKRMAFEGHIAMAQQYQKLYQLPESIISVDPEILAAEAAVRASKYFQLTIPIERVVFVDSPEGAEAARGILSSAKIVGIDVEWKPEYNGKSRASILQIGLPDHVFIFDLLALGSCPELNEALKISFGSSETTIVGFGVREDLSRLAASYPNQACFRNINSVVDLQAAWPLYAAKEGFKTFGNKQAIGLSTVVERILGKPLDKSMQISNWENRPLSLSQVKYAALDAHVLLAVHSKMLTDDDSQGGDSEKFTFSFSYKSPPNHSQTASSGQRYPAYAGESSPTGCAKGVEVRCSDDESTYGIKNADVFDFGSLNLERRPPPRIASSLDSCGLSSAFHWLPSECEKFTAAGAACALGVEPCQIAKSVAFKIKQLHWLAVLRGDRQVDLNKVAAVTGYKRRRVKLASREVCIKIFGYEPGTLPPFGHLDQDIQVLVDPSLEEISLDSGRHLYCGSGTPDGIVNLSFKELLKVSEGKVADITLTTKEPEPQEEDSETDSATLLPGPGKTVKFFLDSMLGRLCRWLRAVGVDAEYLTEDMYAEDIPALAQKISREGRVFITRNYKLAMRKDCAMMYLLGSSDCVEQMKEISRHFGIRYDEERALSRCSYCNSGNFDYTEREGAERPDEIPERIFHAIDAFWRCLDCGKLYWMGPKSKSVIKRMKALLSGDDEAPSQVQEEAGNANVNMSDPDCDT